MQRLGAARGLAAGSTGALQFFLHQVQQLLPANARQSTAIDEVLRRRSDLERHGVVDVLLHAARYRVCYRCPNKNRLW